MARFLRGNLIALLALFIALGGTTYAATALAPNSVGTKQLKKNAVTNPKIKANAVTGAKVANNSIKGADILESSLGIVPNAAKLGGVVAGSYVKSGSVASGALSGTYPNPGLADGSVTSTKIAAGAVALSKIGIIPSARANTQAATLQSIPNNSVTNVVLDAETFDTANLHSTTTNNHLLTAPVAGVYQINGNIRWASNNTGSRFLDISVTGGGRVASVYMTANQGHPTDQSVSVLYALSAGQSVFLEAFQDSGGALALDKGGTDDPNLSMAWVGPSTAGAVG
jgi:hypothetical protein